MNGELFHYGTPRHSGRYPWGSGEDPYQRNKGFVGHVKELREKGLSETEIAKGMGMNTAQLRAKISISNNQIRKIEEAEALKLKDKGYSNVAIGLRMGKNESSVRSLLKSATQDRTKILDTTIKMLKDRVAESTYIDVGSGTELYLGISRTKLKTALSKLRDEEGYTLSEVLIPQLGTQNKTTILVLSPPGTDSKEVFKNRYNIKPIERYSENGGRSFLGLEPIKSVSSDRVKVVYAEDGGIEKDGVIELRRNVPDLSLGSSRYAQVRIGVDGTHYLKGMAMYRDDMPEGVDILFNTNKHRGTPMLGEKDNSVLKPMKSDEDNPFGATVRQRHYQDADGNEQLSAINIVNEEGDWGNWSKSLSSQMISKQSPSLIKKQLDMAYDLKKEEYDEIISYTNPSVKKKLLESFADDCDSSAVHLKAAALPRQGSHVILPFPGIKENEIYAPNYKDGERVVLIRYPHAGIFEIPELTVNNRFPEAKKVIQNSVDAVGINPKVASQLSGADFDGDTVLVIPNNNREIRTRPPLEGLIDFDPKEAYKAYEGMPKVSPENGFRKQRQMGDISNLITDMTIKGASMDEIEKAVKHSMVVIDAEKHNLDWRRSAVDNGIAALKKKYQGRENAGASTLISKASSEERIPGVKKKLSPDPETGEKRAIYKKETYRNKKGEIVERQTKSTKMAEATDAFELSSGTYVESIYATYANKLKALGNQARLSLIRTKNTPYSPSARKTYEKEVASLDAKLNNAQKNAPLERQAQLLANSVVSAKRRANPDLDADDIKKLKGQALSEARFRVGAKKAMVNIEPKEWEAIQAGAISPTKLLKILNNSDLDQVKQYAMPRSKTGLSPAKESRAKSMLNKGYTQAEVAEALGVSVNTIKDLL